MSLTLITQYCYTYLASTISWVSTQVLHLHDWRAPTRSFSYIYITTCTCTCGKHPSNSVHNGARALALRDMIHYSCLRLKAWWTVRLNCVLTLFGRLMTTELDMFVQKASILHVYVSERGVTNCSSKTH